MRRLADVTASLRSVVLAGSSQIRLPAARPPAILASSARPMSSHAMPRIGYPPDDEVVEDSEVEREEQRLQRKIKRRGLNLNPKTKRRIEATSQDSASTRGQTQDREVIVISDDSTDVSLGFQKHVPVVLEHPGIMPPPGLEADDRTWSEGLVLVRDGHLATNNRGVSPTRLFAPLSSPWDAGQNPSAVTPDVQAISQNCHPTVPKEIESPSDSSERRSSAERMPKIPSFSRYAYTASRSSSVSVKTRPIISRGASGVARNSPAADPPPAAKSHRFTTFSDAELTRLLRCVSCGSSWTSRKTVIQKMKHIQACSRKNKLDDGTVTSLIHDELNKIAVVESNAAALAEKAEIAARTLLDNAVQDVVPKKKGRRPKVLETVKELSDTRQSILERARVLLQTKSVSAEQPADLPSTSSIPSSARSHPLTQPFGQSSLALQFCSKAPPIHTQLPVYDPSPSDARIPRAPEELINSPPRTQTFGESNLAKQFLPKASYVDSDSSPIYISSPLAQRNQPSDTIELSPTPRRRKLPEVTDLFLGRLPPERADRNRDHNPRKRSGSSVSCAGDNASRKRLSGQLSSPAMGVSEFSEAEDRFRLEC
ncbi:hypothetical protein BC835DRAFT_1069026 [Cytidiella melzeri]|nr:hypothetical protein BC835DRAFT_1069026 [Cytidiella melzeri]